VTVRADVNNARVTWINDDVVNKESLPNNKKEVLFRTTPLGHELFLAHRAFDEHMERGFVRFLQKYSAEELNFLIRLLQDVVDTSFLNLPSPTIPDHEISRDSTS